MSVLAAEAPATTGTFSGYLASFTTDHEGDTIMGHAAVADSVAAVNSGRMVWHLTDGHSDLSSAVVATVDRAAIDQNGVRVWARWAPTAKAQELRDLVRHQHQLGLSIDYMVDASRPDGKGGRLLDRITIHGGALTNHPMNSMCRITEGKATETVQRRGDYAPIVTRNQAIAADQRTDPGREREDARLAAAEWPPRSWDRDTRLAVLNGLDVARSKALAAAGDDGEARRQAIRDQDNAYSYGLARTMARLRSK